MISMSIKQTFLSSRLMFTRMVYGDVYGGMIRSL